MRNLISMVVVLICGSAFAETLELCEIPIPIGEEYRNQLNTNFEVNKETWNAWIHFAVEYERLDNIDARKIEIPGLQFRKDVIDPANKSRESDAIVYKSPYDPNSQEVLCAIKQWGTWNTTRNCRIKNDYHWVVREPQFEAYLVPVARSTLMINNGIRGTHKMNCFND